MRSKTWFSSARNRHRDHACTPHTILSPRIRLPPAPEQTDDKTEESTRDDEQDG